MANTADGSPTKVNPVLLILLGVTLVGAALYTFVFDKPVTPNALPQAAFSPTGDAGTGGSPKKPVPPEKQAGAGGALVADGGAAGALLLERNPFLTPGIYLRINENQHENQPANQQQQTSQLQPTTKPPDTQDIKPTEPEIKLGAVFRKFNDKVALIYFGGKGYILRENEALKNGYRITKIAEDSVCLVNNNGEEKTLRLEEKPLKLKGGGR